MPGKAGYRSVFREFSAKLRKEGGSAHGLLTGAGSATLRRRFDPDEELVPFDVIASRIWPTAWESLVQQFEVDDLVGLQEKPVLKTLMFRFLFCHTLQQMPVEWRYRGRTVTGEGLMYHEKARRRFSMRSHHARPALPARPDRPRPAASAPDGHATFSLLPGPSATSESRHPENGSASSFSRQSCTRESMPFLPSMASIATRMRSCGVI